jgi:hypothetical protein
MLWGMGGAVMTESASDPTTIRRLYGRRQGHALRQGQAALFADLLPHCRAGRRADHRDRPVWR